MRPKGGRTGISLVIIVLERAAQQATHTCKQSIHIQNTHVQMQQVISQEGVTPRNQFSSSRKILEASWVYNVIITLAPTHTRHTHDTHMQDKLSGTFSRVLLKTRWSNALNTTSG